MSLTRVYNTVTGEEIYYSLTPDKAVIAAYAQSLKDWRTWDYAQRYGHLLREGECCYFCGNYAAMKTDPKPHTEIAPDKPLIFPEGWESEGNDGG